DGTFTDFLPGEVTRGVSVPLDGVVGMNIRDALPAFAGPLRRLMQRASSTGRLQRVEFEMAGNGEPRFYEARCIPFGDEEVLLILRDFTAVKWHEGEEERRRIRDELDNKVERLRTNPYGLTYRELTILHLVSEGSADKQIAEALGISIYTVNKHVGNILGKMNAVSRTEAGVRAVKEGLLGGEHP
ncbi:MAG TPA: LuxR C-terminal-related transcriptional regulator, partial [Dehalococcoidia bacterium]|nr:LuxR C-terminal-related transcriptional regulator [Dehalococcoidia bacterium]